MACTAQESPFPLEPHFEVCRVRPAHFEGFGRGMKCKEHVSKGEDLLTISVSKCWTAAAAKRCPELAALGDDVLEAVSDATLIALHILVVKSQGPAADGVRRDHVATLASADFETLLDWSEQDVQLLQGSKWAMVAPACRRDIEEEFAELQDLLGDFLAAYAVDRQGFLWAHRLLISRSVQFFMEDGAMLYLLGPGQDMFNHSVEAPIGNDDVHLRTAGPNGEQMLVISAYKDFEAGEQAFYSYSAASNGRLLMMAGFVIPGNPFDSVELALNFPVTDASLPLYQQLAIGLDAGTRTPGTVAAADPRGEILEVAETEDGLPPAEVALHITLGRNTPTAQLERVLAFLRLGQICHGGQVPTAEQLAACDADAASRSRSLQQLQGSLQAMQQRYGRSLDEDEADLPASEAQAATGDAVARRKANALHVLIGEKRVFRHVCGLLADLGS